MNDQLLPVPKSYILIARGIYTDKDLLKKPKSIILMGMITTLLNTTGKFYMSNKRIAEELDVSVKSIKDYLNLLESKGLIERKIVKAENSEAIIGRYIVAGKNIGKYTSQGWGSGVTEGRVVELPTLGKQKYHKEYIKENNKDNINNTNATDVAGVQGKGEQVSEPSKPPKRDIEAEFNELWAIYPNKKGKKQAFNHYKAWAKRSTKNTKEIMESKLKAFISYLQYRHTDPRYIPYGSTWFNGGYDDDYSLPKLPPTEPEGFGAPESHAIDQGNPNILNIPDDELPF